MLLRKMYIILDITNLATTTALNAKINRGQKQISIITNLATTIALTAVENIYLMLVIQSKKTDCNIKITEIDNEIATDQDHDKYIPIQEINKLTSENFTARPEQANFACKCDTANFGKKRRF